MTMIEYLKKIMKKYLIEEKTSFSFILAIICYVAVSGPLMAFLPYALSVLMDINNLPITIFPPVLMFFYGYIGRIYEVLFFYMLVVWITDIKYPFLRKIWKSKNVYYQIGAGFIAGIGFVILGFVIWIALNLYGVI